ncbi:PIN domain-containing protein [Streptomyces fuscigenes]|uniref:PIN domain-containing protein n=1 Tax=Streptomyces fuscigenes TaxID=1528880 RepID=UPI001F1DE38D|nr:PIN domain-containing protein [Streptomyces fuscigenes]MCF3960426.1 PIN domain-containing protein [Streptomyces fuscigenes]
MLFRVAQAGLVRAKWTEEILDEMFRNLKNNRPDLDADKLDVMRAKMRTSVRDWRVAGYEPIVASLELPDPGDRHVLAAAIRAKAQCIVTANLRDFPREALEPWNVEAVHPDDFLEARISEAPETVYGIIEKISNLCRRPPLSTADVIETLAKTQMPNSVEALRRLDVRIVRQVDRVSVPGRQNPPGDPGV